MGDVDNLRYDPATHRVYVGFGEDETGAVGIGGRDIERALA